MIRFLRKYSFNIILFLILAGLYFIHIPYEEGHYFYEDMDLTRKKSHSVVVIVLSVFIIVLLILGLRSAKKIKEVFRLIARLGMISLVFYFILVMFFFSAALSINRLYKGRKVEKTYEVFQVDTENRSLYLWDNQEKVSFDASLLIAPCDFLPLGVGDIIVVSFDKGLFGIKFDPAIKEIRNYYLYKRSLNQ